MPCWKPTNKAKDRRQQMTQHAEEARVGLYLFAVKCFCKGSKDSSAAGLAGGEAEQKCTWHMSPRQAQN